MPTIIESTNTKKLLIYTLAQFQTNANTVYPSGTIIYYRRGNGQITGIYKLSDGVTTLRNLPMLVNDYIIQSDDYTHTTKEKCLFDSLTNNYNNTGYWLGSTIAKAGRNVTTANVNNMSYLSLFPLWYPATIYGIGTLVATYTTAGNINLAIYQPNATYNSWNLVAGSNTPNMFISTTGYNIYTYPTPFTLDVGMYGLLWNIHPTTRIRLYYVPGGSNAVHETARIGLRYYPSSFVRTQSISAAPYGTVPATINTQLLLSFDHVQVMYLLHTPAI